jgi:hypothetical protein
LLLVKITITIEAKNEPNYYKFATIEFYLFLENFLRSLPMENRREFHLFPKFFPFWYKRPNLLKRLPQSPRNFGKDKENPIPFFRTGVPNKRIPDPYDSI